MQKTETYHQALKEQVCGICLDRKEDGSCNLPTGRTCAIELHLPLTIQAVQSVHSDRIADYANAIREMVCSQCPNQDETGRCQFRRDMDCALDNFAYLVVDAIDEVDSRPMTAAESA